MRISNRLLTILVAAGLLAGSPGLLEGRTKQGDKLLAQGLEAEQQKQWDKALDLLTQALAQDPGDVSYRLAFLRARFQAAQAHVDLGQRLRLEGKMEEAIVEFEKARSLDASSYVAVQELQRTRDLIERAAKPNQTLADKLEQKGLSPVEAARRETEEKLSAVLSVPELKPLSVTPITLKINNQPPKVVFETIGKLAGVNVLFDPDFATQNTVRSVSLDLSNATLDQALDYAGMMTRSFWKPVSSNAVFVTMDVQNKRAEYEEQVAKVFYLTNTTLPTELAEIIGAIRTITNVQRMMPAAAQNAIIVRGSPDQVALAELLIHDLDRPRPEVVVDVIVMEVSRSRTRDLSAALLSGGAPGISVPIGFTPRNPLLKGGGSDTTTAAAKSSLISLAQIGKVSSNDFSLTLPGAILEALMGDSSTKVLQSPQVRTVDSQKATLKIGEKYPISTGGFQSAFGQVGTGINSLYNQVTFQDIGVNLDLTPKVHNSEEVSLHIELDISAVRGTVSLGGIDQPIIGQRKVVHDIRLREGEVSLLGGLLQNQERKSVSGVPGLSNIPILGRLFTSETLQRDESELLIAIIPHIVRTQDFSHLNFKGIAMGTERTVRLSYAPRPGAQPAAAEAPKPAPPAAEAPVPLVPQPAAPAPGPPVPAAPPAPARIVFAPETIEAQAGAAITVNLQVENITDLFAAPLRIKFDQNLLRLNEVTRGDLLVRDGKQAIFTRNILNDTGEAIVNLSRMPASEGVSGSGVLVTLTFQAVKAGAGTISIEQVNLQNAKQETVLSASPKASVNIK